MFLALERRVAALDDQRRRRTGGGHVRLVRAGLGGMPAIAALSLGVALLTGVMSRIIVHRSLRQLG